MIEKIMKFYTEEELLDMIIFQCGNEEKVQYLIAELVSDENFVDNNIDLLLRHGIGLDKILEMVNKTKSPEWLHKMAVVLFNAEAVDNREDICNEFRNILTEILTHPCCSGKTIVMAEDEYNFWVDMVALKCNEPKYSTEKLREILDADEKGSCFWYITNFINCDKDLFYMLFEKSRSCGHIDIYTDFCRQALTREDIDRTDIIEEAFTNLTMVLKEKNDVDVEYHLEMCQEKYLERVMELFEKMASGELLKMVREIYEERKRRK